MIREGKELSNERRENEKEEGGRGEGKVRGKGREGGRGRTERGGGEREGDSLSL